MRRITTPDKGLGREWGKEGYLAVVEENAHKGDERAGLLRGHLVLPGAPGYPDIVVPDDGLLKVVRALRESHPLLHQRSELLRLCVQKLHQQLGSNCLLVQLSKNKHSAARALAHQRRD